MPSPAEGEGRQSPIHREPQLLRPLLVERGEKASITPSPLAGEGGAQRRVRGLIGHAIW